jgi:hypothetical protein
MSRTEAIAIITRKIETLDDEQVSILAGIAQDLGAVGATSLELTPQERSAIERSKADFKTGRVVSVDQYQSEMSSFMDGLRSKYP